ncbi:solute carrier family 25 member 35-like [Babylonia areolata]|uniref:solute carrier family 25 member 35-like n=1 Tax=Babylonia areolata TaxID=304850 RepID=UPI003FD34BE3
MYSESTQKRPVVIMERNNAVEFLLGGMATCAAGFFTNPLEVVKTRMQLQGELKATGQYNIHYRNAFHAFWTIARNDGVTALQSGLVPALYYQFFMNGVRLGIYQVLINMGFTHKEGELSIPRSIAAGALAGCLGASLASPFYMVKTHLQSQAVKEIAVGFQHSHGSMSEGLRAIYSEHGMLGLWRGVSGAAGRVTVGSAAQLSSFSAAKDMVVKTKIFPENSWLNAFVASMLSGLAVTMFMTPFDVVSTRLYNQGLDSGGRGLLYSGVGDAFIKIFRTEGLWGFYKGWAASYFRLGPHTVLSLVFWDEFRKLYLSIGELEGR